MRGLAGLAALTVIATTPALAQSWRVEREESVSLQYRDARDEVSLLEVHCTGSESQIVVPAPKGLRDRKPLRLEVAGAAGSEALQLPASICGRTEGECVDRPVGDVSVWLLRRSGRDLALRFAGAVRITTAGGVSLSAAASPTVFADFASLCRKQRRIPAG